MLPGRVSISARALEKVVTAIAADELQVRPKDVAVRLADSQGLLAVDVVSPLRLARLGESGAGGSGDTIAVLDRCQTARSGIRTRALEITGSQVRSVAIRITRASIQAGTANGTGRVA